MTNRMRRCRNNALLAAMSTAFLVFPAPGQAEEIAPLNSLIKTFQQRLTEIGCDSGGVSGEYDAATQEAIRRFRLTTPAAGNPPKDPILGVIQLQEDLDNAAEDSCTQHLESLAILSGYGAGINRFGANLLLKLIEEQPNQASILSPLGLYSALHMAADGSAGETAKAFSTLFNVNDLATSGTLLAEILSTINSTATSGQSLSRAGGMFLSSAIPIKPDYVKAQQENYGSEPRVVDFKAAETLEEINRWVRENTQGEIEKVLDQLDPNAVLVLLDVLQFKGRWAQEFDPEMTASRTFHSTDGKHQQHPFMVHPHITAPYRETEHYRQVALPFKDGELEAVFILPKENQAQEGLKWLPGALNTERAPMPGNFIMPLLDLKTDNPLNKPLSRLGLAPAMGDEADFTRMSDTPVAISNVKQAVFVRMNEQGAEAGAASTVEISSRSLVEKTTFKLELNRPFYFSINHLPTGVSLFIGYVGSL